MPANPMPAKRSLRRSLVTAAFAALTTAGVVAAPTTANAAVSTVDYLCPVTVDGSTFVLNYQRTYDVTAPATAQRGQTFTITFDSAPINPLTQFNTEVWNVKIVFKLPAASTYVSHTLTGGDNLGSSRQFVRVHGDQVEYHASGPFTAGEDHDLPNLNVVVRAPWRPATLQTAPGGTSGDRPGFRWTAEDPATGEIGDLECYPDPARPVVFSTTTVS